MARSKNPTKAEARVLAMIESAADAGLPCPSNYAIADAMGATSEKGSRVVQQMWRAGFITVELGAINRVVTVVSSGKRTAGEVKGTHRRDQADNRSSSNRPWQDRAVTEKVGEDLNSNKAVASASARLRDAMIRLMLRQGRVALDMQSMAQVRAAAINYGVVL